MSFFQSHLFPLSSEQGLLETVKKGGCKERKKKELFSSPSRARAQRPPRAPQTRTQSTRAPAPWRRACTRAPGPLPRPLEVRASSPTYRRTAGWARGRRWGAPRGGPGPGCACRTPPSRRARRSAGPSRPAWRRTGAWTRGLSSRGPAWRPPRGGASRCRRSGRAPGSPAPRASCGAARACRARRGAGRGPSAGGPTRRRGPGTARGRGAP